MNIGSAEVQMPGRECSNLEPLLVVEESVEVRHQIIPRAIEQTIRGEEVDRNCGHFDPLDVEIRPGMANAVMVMREAPRDRPAPRELVAGLARQLDLEAGFLGAKALPGRLILGVGRGSPEETKQGQRRKDTPEDRPHFDPAKLGAARMARKGTATASHASAMGKIGTTQGATLC